MTRQEFLNRTLVNVSEKEYAAIETVYMASDLEKDEFCKMWCKMNASRVKAAKVERMENERRESYKYELYRLVEKYERKQEKIGFCAAYEILTADMVNTYSVRAMSYFGVEVCNRMSDTCYGIRCALKNIA